MKIVLDANVIIAAFAARGLCESIMEVCLSEHEIVLSDDLFDEIQRWGCVRGHIGNSVIEMCPVQT